LPTYNKNSEFFFPGGEIKMANTTTKKTTLKSVKFNFSDGSAKFVSLVGEFNEWQSGRNLMKKDSKGNFTAALKLAPGTYSFKFLADSGWKTDPTIKTVTDSLGNENNQITVE
jgi:1,4-alpha-glucan branching enzyme